MWNILTTDGIYCSYVKWICSSKGKYYKSLGRVLKELQSEIAAASKIRLSLFIMNVNEYLGRIEIEAGIRLRNVLK